MTRKIPIILLLLYCVLSSQAQNAVAIIEDLKNKLKTNDDKKSIAVIYSDLTWYYSSVSIDSALYYGNKAVAASKELGDSTLIAQVYSDIGAVYFRKGDFKQSKQNYLKAYAIRKRKNDVKGLAKLNNNLANVYEKEQQYKIAMNYSLAALDYFEAVNDAKNIQVIKSNIGLILFKIKNYKKAFTYINDAIKYQEASQNNEDLCVSYINLGNIYLQLNDTANALKMYGKSITACKIVGNKKGMASAYNNIATIKTEQKKSREAMALYAESLKERNELNTDLDRANFDFNIAKELIQKSDYKQAKNILLKTKDVFSEAQSNANLLLNYKALIEVYSKMNLSDSVNYYVNELMALNNTMTENSVSKETVELETKYQTVKKEKLLLEKERETREKSRVIFLILSGAVLLLFLILMLYRQQIQKRKQQTREFALREEIAQIETQNMLQEQRISISRDLHDNIGSHLTFIISSINNLIFRYKNENESLVTQLKKVEDFASETISELRDTIWAMDVKSFNFDDLKNRLINFIEKQKAISSDFQIVFEVENNFVKPVLNSFAGITIYRIIQEFTNNTLKHSKAKTLRINISGNNDEIYVLLQDDGVGFDMENCNHGHGLYNMQKRCDELEGEMKFNSEVGKGANLQLTFKTKILK